MKGVWKGKPGVKKIEKEKMLSVRITQGIPFHTGYHTWKKRWIK